MNNNLHKMFSQTECPSQEVLKNYFDNKLSGSEKHLVEEHLVDCEMCSDELEGLSLLKDEESVKVIVDSLNKKITGKKTRTVKLEFRILAAVAIITLVIGIVYVLQNIIVNNQPDFIVEQNETAKPKADYIHDEANMAEAAKSNAPKQVVREKMYEDDVESEEKKQVIVIPIVDDAEVFEEVAEDDIDLDYDMTDVEVPEAKIESELVQEDTPDKALVKLKESEKNTNIPQTITAKTAENKVSNDLYTSATADEVVEVKDAKMERDSKSRRSKTTSLSANTDLSRINNLLIKAIEKYESEKYRASVNLLKKVLDESPENHVAHYYIAASCFELKEYNSTILYLNKILDNPESEYSVKAMFLKAKTLIQLDDPANARTLLQKIVDDNGELKEDAKKLLDTL